MPTLEQLGQKVKAKFPGQYDDLSDIDLATRVKAKHPGAYDDFVSIPPNPSDSIPAAKAPVPAGLQGPPPSRTEQLVQNLPQSAVNAITHPTFPGMPTDAPPMDPNDERSMAEKWAQEELPKIGHAIRHPINTVRDAFVSDPVGSTLTAAQLGKAAYEYGPAVVDAAQRKAAAVTDNVKSATSKARAILSDPRVARETGGAVGGMVGGTLGHATGIPYAGMGGAYMGRRIGTAIVDAAQRPGLPPSVEAPPMAEPAPAPAPEPVPTPNPTADLSLEGVPFDKLSPALQKVVLDAAEKAKNPPPPPQAAPVDLAPPPSVEKAPEPVAPVKTVEQVRDEIIAANKAKLAAAQAPVVPPPQAPPNGPAAEMPIPKDFGTNEARSTPVLPGHTRITSKGVHSAGFNPETGVPEIHFGNGGLYRYPNLPPEALREAMTDAPSMGAWVREKLRANPVWHNGYQRVQLPDAMAPNLPGVEPGVPPARGTLKAETQGADSWVAVDKATGKAVLETFEKKTADAINRERFDVVPTQDYLGGLNQAHQLDLGGNASPKYSKARGMKASAAKRSAAGNTAPGAPPSPEVPPNPYK